MTGLASEFLFAALLFEFCPQFSKRGAQLPLGRKTQCVPNLLSLSSSWLQVPSLVVSSYGDPTKEAELRQADKPPDAQERPAKNPEAGYVVLLSIVLAVSLSSILWP